jgi:transposase
MQTRAQEARAQHDRATAKDRHRRPADLPSRSPKAHTSSTDEKEAFARQSPVHVGVDTGKTFHKLVARGPDGRRTKALRVDVSRAGFDAADAYLTTTFPGVPRERMLVALEFAGHNGFTFAHFLARSGYKVVSVLPTVTKALKKVEDNSPAKDDAKDAAQICKCIGQGFYVTFPLLDDQGAELRALATERHRLAVEETRLVNRLHSALDLAWPEFAAQFSTLDKATPIALLERWSVPQDLTASTTRTVNRVVKEASRNHIGPERIRALITSARDTIAVQEGTAARRAEIQRLLTRWALVRTHAEDVETRLAVRVDAHPAAAALTTVPGVGVVCAAPLVAELGDPAWYESPRQVVKLAGMTLTKKESGTSVRGRPRQSKHGRPLLRRQLFLLAGRWCQTRGLYREQYLALQQCGQSKTAAVCAIARKLVPLLFMVMRTGEPFGLARWRRNRHHRDSEAESPYRHV